MSSKCCVPRLRDDSLRWAKAESLFERAHLIVAATAERVQGQRRIELQDMLKLLNDISRGTRALLEDEEVFRVLVAHMSRLKIPSFYLGRAPSPLAADGEARLLLAYDAEHGARLPEPVPFRAGQWLPPGYAPSRRHTVVAQLFSFGDGSHGFCVSELGPSVGILYESVREMINSGMQSAHLLRQSVRKT
jgi:hypothetical protein